MSLSLQEQLLKAGLADKKKATSIKNEKRKKDKLKRKNKIVEADTTKESVQNAQAAKKEKDQALNKEKKLAEQKKAEAAQIVQLIDMNKQLIKDGNQVFKFTDDNKIKQLYVNEQQSDHLKEGKLAVVSFNNGYELVPVPVADKIAERDERVILYRADKVETTESDNDPEDWYADYQIPDDLTW